MFGRLERVERIVELPVGGLYCGPHGEQCGVGMDGEAVEARASAEPAGRMASAGAAPKRRRRARRDLWPSGIAPPAAETVGFSGAMAAGSSPRRRFAQAARASRLAALMRITVETIAFSNLK